MSLKLHVVLLANLFTFSVSSPVLRSPVVNTQQGRIQGTSLTDQVDAFLGIPYAQPPIGPLRFQPPQPLGSRVNGNQVLNASSYGPVCYQFHYRTTLEYALVQTTPESEDCLNLNIFVPHDRDHSQLLPVFVWSYGGAFGEGGGSVPIYNPTSFVETNKNIIFVTWK